MATQPLSHGRSKALLYVRVSTQMQAVEGHSLEHQKAVLTKLCEQGDERGEIEVLRIFEEPGVSAKTLANRPAINAAIQFARENLGRGDYFMVYEISRIARSASDAIWLLSELAKIGVLVRDANRIYDFDASNRLQYGIQAVFAEYDNNLKAQQTRDRMTTLTNMGRWLHKTPFGYRRGRRDEVSLLVDKAEAEVVVRIFDACRNGRTPVEISRMVSLSQAWLERFGEGSDHVNLKRVLRILSDKKYLGIMHTKLLDEPIQGDWEAIINASDFDEVQTILVKGVHVPHGAKPELYPLKKALTCGNCGGNFTAFHTKKGRYGYYQCMQCRKVRISVEKAHEQFAELLTKSSIPIVILPAVRNAIREKALAEIAASAKQCREIEKAIAATTQDYERLVLMLTDSNLSTFRVRQIERLVATKEEVIQTLEKEFAELTKLDSSFVDEAMSIGEELLTQPARTWELLEHRSRAAFAIALYPCRVQCDGGALQTHSSLAIASKIAGSEQGHSYWHPQRDSNPCRHLERVVS